MTADRRPDTIGAATPPTTKGRAAKGRILAGLRSLLESQPYSSVRIADIAEAADLSQGAVYRYFSDKREILLTLLRTMTTEAYVFARAHWEPSDPMRSVRDTTSRYLEFYERNRALLAVTAELAQTDDAVRDIWRRSQRDFHQRIEHALERGVVSGVVRDDLALALAAELLGGMTEFYAYRRYVLGFTDSRLGSDDIIDGITALWAHGTSPLDSQRHA